MGKDHELPPRNLTSQLISRVMSNPNSSARLATTRSSTITRRWRCRCRFRQFPVIFGCLFIFIRELTSGNRFNIKNDKAWAWHPSISALQRQLIFHLLKLKMPVQVSPHYRLKYSIDDSIVGRYSSEIPTQALVRLLSYNWTVDSI